MRKIRVASLFAGIGGFERGLEFANIPYDNVFVSEIDMHAQKSYLVNFKPKIIVGDITKIKEKHVPNHDLLLAGFPCQAFSIAGKRRGFDDTRGTLFFDVLRILKEKKPKYFILENVKNLVSHENSKTIRIILDNLSIIGYTVDFTIINAKEAGVPQSRERTYIVGIRDHKFEKYDEDLRNNKINKLKKELNCNSYSSFNLFNNLVFNNKKKTLKDVMEKGVVDEKYYFNTEKIKNFLESLDLTYFDKKYDKTKINKVLDIPREYHSDHERQRRVYSPNGISPTVLARSDTSKILIIENKKPRIRKVTPLENFKIQGYDDEFTNKIIKTSGNSNTQLYKQSGNAVSPRVIEGIAKQLFGGIA